MILGGIQKLPVNFRTKVSDKSREKNDIGRFSMISKEFQSCHMIAFRLTGRAHAVPGFEIPWSSLAYLGCVKHLRFVNCGTALASG